MKKTLKNTTAALTAAAVIFSIPACAKFVPDDSGIEPPSASSVGVPENPASVPEGSSGTDEIEKVPIKVVHDTFNDEIEKLKTAKVGRISFENLKSFSFPDVTELTEYEIFKKDRTNSGLTPEQFFDKFVAYCEFFAPGKFTRDEIAEKAGLMGNFEQRQQTEEEEQEQIERGWYTWGCMTYNEFLENNTDGDLEIHYMALETSDFYFAYFGRFVPYIYNSDSAKTYLHNDEPRSPLFSSHFDGGIVYYTEDMNCTDAYHLVDGDISIADAAKKVNDYLAEVQALFDDGGHEFTAATVRVQDIGDGNYNYIFSVTPDVDGIKYAFYDMRSDSSSYTYNDGGFSPAQGSAEMFKSDDIYSIMFDTFWDEKTPVETYDSIVPVDVAAEMAAKILASNMSFKAKSVSLVYEANSTTNELFPCWRFLLQNVANPEKYYQVYVNALTGNTWVKVIQEIYSGHEFD